MTVQHSNPTQQTVPVDFKPLLKDEGPYVNNLNRAPKNAYDYANNLNTIFSYSGSISRVLPNISTVAYNLYDIVHLLDGEVIEPGNVATMQPNYRFGIVVSELDANGNIFICTFSPNFIFPSSISFAATPGTALYLSNTSSDVSNGSTTASGLTTTQGTIGTIGHEPIAIVTGTHSVFFSGTARIFTSVPLA
jgi:hypothetical protein